ncbi:outer membrane protein assembly factor BamA [Rhizobium sp. L1K21]|uniref:outer membrane protein assembly factor BamA n=1 Tax=Rhizobium sp. L1K21 TaxID=2954933 RepID=UPI0020922968|nr:outer membrane protein assembly factor BamA [Rhizobium sp. L1K21]MCO6185995.1 outer membrane protein assembly factor BamA [Rhizobium sp. L1K21]
MKAGSKFLSAVSAVALSAGVVASGTGVLLASATVAEAAVIRSISVRGANRVGADAVRDNLTIAPGKSFSNADIDESVRRLYSTGFFSDVRINVSGSTLVVNVSENKLVNQVVFNGNRKIKDDKLAAIVRTRALGPYSQSLIESDIQSIKEAYAAIGRSDVTVTTQTYAVGEGRTNLAFVINEGGRTKITHINFIGNNAYSDSRLQSVIQTKESNFLSFLTRRDVYSEAKLNADEELLRRFYYNRGYADFRIVSADAVLDEATNEYTINITVDEGERYQFGNVDVVSTVDGVSSEELQKLVDTRSGDRYSAEDVEKSMSAISKKVAAAGYPFVRVTPRGDRDFANNTIGVEYLVDQGERAYVERIEIRGNTRTRDYVIRREFDFAEGDAFNQEMIASAKRRLERLGFFSSVNISTAPGSEPDRVVVIVDVEDQSTGNFGIGGGYATGGEGIILEASIEEKNFLGRGQFIRVSAGGGRLTRTYNVSFTEPYFLGYRLAAGFDIYLNRDSTQPNYTYENQGFALRVTAPITEDLSTTFKYTYDKLKYTSSNLTALSAPYQNVVNGSPWMRSAISNTISYNSLDDQVNPHEGLVASLTQEIAGLGGDSHYYKIYGRARYFYTLSDEADIVASLAGSAGHLVSLKNSVNVYDQFRMGSNEIRGFDTYGVGPRLSNGDTLGGTTYFTVSAEATFPLPGISPEIGLRGGVFADAGTLFGNDVNLSGATANGISSSLRASVGASLIWASPFGPLRFDYAFPVMKQPHDQIQRFKFGIQTNF